MDHTGFQTGAPATKAAETSIQPGPPPSANGARIDATEPTARPRSQSKNPFVQALELLASLRITVVLFLMSLLLVFWGTLPQVDNGVWTVVNTYFRTFFVLVPIKVILFNAVDLPGIVIPYPGGLLLGGVMLVNLLAAHAVRFKLAWNRSGIILIHAGIIIMMLSEVVTCLFAVEGQMIIPVGQTVNQVIHAADSELAIIRTLDPKQDDVIVVPAVRFKTGAEVQDEKLPFKIEVVQYMVNSQLVDAKDGAANQATKGFGRVTQAQEVGEVAGVDTNQRHDAPSLYAKLTSREGKDLGTWLYSVNFEQPQWIEVDGKKYQVALRFKQRARQFSFHLTRFKHDLFPGVDKPRDFHSYLRLIDPEEGIDRDVEIYMNAPLRYRGETFYQSSWTTDPISGVANGTILQVVRNPGWLMPYLSCLVVGVGMLIHFGITLTRFLKRRVIA